MGSISHFLLLGALRCSIQCIAGKHLLKVNSVKPIVLVAEFTGDTNLALFGEYGKRLFTSKAAQHRGNPLA